MTPLGPPPVETPLEVVNKQVVFKSNGRWTGWLNLIHQIVERLSDSTGAYVVTNVTPTRSFDASSTTVNELAMVLGTLIDDLKQKGILS